MRPTPKSALFRVRVKHVDVGRQSGAAGFGGPAEADRRKRKTVSAVGRSKLTKD